MSGESLGTASLLLIELEREPAAAQAVLAVACAPPVRFSRLELTRLQSGQMLTLQYPDCDAAAMERMAKRLLNLRAVVGVTGCFALAKED